MKPERHALPTKGQQTDPSTLLAGLLAAPLAPVARPCAEARPWAAPAHLRPARGRRPAPARAIAPAAAARPLLAAATLLLAGGVAAAGLGAAPARAEMPAGRALASPSVALVSTNARGTGAARAALHVAPAAPADRLLLQRLLAAPAARPAAAADAALLAELLAAEPAAAPPPSVGFATVKALPATAFAYSAAAVQLPAITLADNVPPPPPPVPIVVAQQPPPPAGYVQPPGYQDGVPFGGQIGAVPAGRPVVAVIRPQTVQPATVTRPATATVYTVRAGDTLSVIALRVYGNAAYAPLIWEANYRLIGANPNLLYPGYRLTLPGVAAQPATRPATVLPARGPISQRAYYIIQPQDYLRWIAQRAYGTERFWPEIYAANRKALGANPDLIYPGVQVYIP